MRDYFVDLHIHIGRTSKNKRVKYAAANNLTFENIAEECINKKGIDMIGIIDCSSPNVIDDMKAIVSNGMAHELIDGGILYKNKLCIIPGAEIETTEAGDNGSCAGHSLCFFPSLDSISRFSDTMSKYIKNINLSSQKASLSVKQLLEIVEQYNGILVPAHVFSPHKGYYGNCTNSLFKLLGDSFERVSSVELGLSADSDMADQISELSNKTFISNSDAHSLQKIGREYNIMCMENLSFKELQKVLRREDGRMIKSNCGLNPKLGKYHRTFCEKCNSTLSDDKLTNICPTCGSKTLIGVFDRIEMIKDRNTPIKPHHRPKYIHQVPLEYIPGIGSKTIEKLISQFGSEMNILNYISESELETVIKKDIAKNIIKARNGDLQIEPGGGGVYGSIK